MRFKYTVSNILLSSSTINQSQSSIWRYSVITVSDVDTTTNHVGFILNQRISNISHQQISSIYDLKYTLPKCPVYCGGPVMTDRCTIFHSPEYSTQDTRRINTHCALTFNDQIVQDIVQGRGPKHWKVMLGMCQWQPGQLDAEIIRPGGWLEQAWDPMLCWGSYRDKHKMWRRLIEKQSSQDAKMFLNRVFDQ